MMFTKSVPFTMAFLAATGSQPSSASNSFDWTPSVSLSENHGVDRGLCIDIVGAGSGMDCDAPLQLHTCKSQGRDTQFAYIEAEGSIRSVNYDANCGSTGGDVSQGACLKVFGSGVNGDLVGLASCEAGADDQSFSVSEGDGTIRGLGNLCLAKTSEVGPAGPNERTDLGMVDCGTADPADITWTVATGSTGGGPTTCPSRGTDCSADASICNPGGSDCGLECRSRRRGSVCVPPRRLRADE